MEQEAGRIFEYLKIKKRIVILKVKKTFSNLVSFLTVQDLKRLKQTKDAEHARL